MDDRTLQAFRHAPRRRIRGVIVAIAWLCASLAGSGAAFADDGPRFAVPGSVRLGADGAIEIPMSSVEVLYVQPVPGLPALAPLLGRIEFPLAEVEPGVFAAPGQGRPEVRVRLGAADGGPTEGSAAGAPSDPGSFTLCASAIQTICRAIQLGFARSAPPLEVFVSPDPERFELVDLTGRPVADRRGAPTEPIRILVAFDGPTLRLERFELAYRELPAGAPAAEDILRRARASLVRVEGVLTGWRPIVPGVEAVEIEVAQLPRGADGFATLTVAGVQRLLEATSVAFQRDGLLGVTVVPAPGQLGPGLVDQRSDASVFRAEATVRRVARVRTLARGERGLDPAEDRDEHALIRRQSPIAPQRAAGAEVEAEEPGDPGEAETLFRRTLVDDYLFRLGRHPGRRVDAVAAPGENPDELLLNYVVTENKPWLIYYFGSNTGTRSGNRWRSRFGFFHSQLTNRDDILALDYDTTDFDENWAFFGSYSARVGDLERLRWRIFGSYDQSSASDFARPFQDFESDRSQVGAELAWNVLQRRDFFLDLLGGLRWQKIRVERRFFALEGEEDWMLGYLGAQIERLRADSRLQGRVTLERTFGISDPDPQEVARLGRILADDSWTVLRFSGSASIYLDPIFANLGRKPGEPEAHVSLVHEILLRANGQYAFDNRLIPQEESVVGGLFSVRGYPEAAIAGDNSVVASAEYRIHLPSAFGFQEPGELFGSTFRFVPQYPYSRADWDLVLKGFVDVGWIGYSNALFFEQDQNLLSIGVGLEGQFRSNLSVRLDWGFVVEEIPGVNQWSNRLGVAVTVVY